MSLVYRRPGCSPCSEAELNDHDDPGYTTRFGTIVVPIAVDGLLGTHEDSIIKYWNREWVEKSDKFSKKYKNDILKAKGENIRLFAYTRGGVYHSISCIGIPVTPFRNGILQYSWFDTGLARIRTELESTSCNAVAIANVIRPKEDEGVDWDTVRSIIEKRFGDWRGKCYIYPPLIQNLSIPGGIDTSE